MTVEWVDELPGRPYEATHRNPRPNKPQDRSKDLWDHAAELMANPMRWARYPRPLTWSSATRLSDAIREGTIAAYRPDAGFQSASREGVCYVRYNPEAKNPYNVAYGQGYADGRKDAMSDVGVALWSFRRMVAGIEGWEDHRAEDSQRGTTKRVHSRKQEWDKP